MVNGVSATAAIWVYYYYFYYITNYSDVFPSTPYQASAASTMLPEALRSEPGSWPLWNQVPPSYPRLSRQEILQEIHTYLEHPYRAGKGKRGNICNSRHLNLRVFSAKKHILFYFKVTSKDEKIASLESAMVKLQEHCQLLQDSLHNSIPTVGFTAPSSSQSRPATSHTTSSGLPPLHAVCEQNRPTSSRVPYEAEGTLRLNHLSKTGRSLSSLVDQKTGEYGDRFLGLSNRSTSECASASTLALNVEELADSDKISNTSRRNGVSVSTQTTETAFALCARCSETQNCLVSIADRVSAVCSRHAREKKPSLAATDWASLARVGGLEIGEWERALHDDLSTIDGYCCKLEESCTRLALQIDTQKETIESLHSEARVLTSQINSLRADWEDLRLRSEASLARSKEESARQQRELQLAVRQLEARNGELAEKLSAVREQEKHLRSRVTQLGMSANHSISYNMYNLEFCPHWSAVVGSNHH